MSQGCCWYFCHKRGETPININAFFRSSTDWSYSEPRVYVPLWAGDGQIYTIQKVLPSDIPTFPLSKDQMLPGETIHPCAVPTLLYDLCASHSYAYSGRNIEDAARRHLNEIGTPSVGVAVPVDVTSPLSGTEEAYNEPVITSTISSDDEAEN